MIRAVALGLLLALTSPVLAEDSIELETGRVLEGEIVRDEELWIGIDTGDGVVWVKRVEIKSISRGVEPEPEPEPAPTPVPAESEDPVPVDPGKRADGERVETPAPASRKATPIPNQASAAAGRDERLSAEAEHVRMSLASEDHAVRVKAANWIVETWPRWRSEVQHALTKAKDETARLEAVRILDRENVTDEEQLVDIALDDKSARVRTAALRIARHRKFTGVESRAVELMRSDPTWVVRQEAIRTLEDVGGSMCLPHVMAAWSSEIDKDKRRRYRRVMKALLGDDFGDDAVGWYRAADELFMGDREIRKGKKKTADDN